MNMSYYMLFLIFGIYIGIIKLLIVRLPGLVHVAQSVASLSADPGVASLILAQVHTFMKIDHEIISTVILFLPLIQEGLFSVTSESMCMKYGLSA